MNLYKKLAKSRVDLQEMKLKKSGNNTFSHFTYYELSDFLGAINAICAKNGLLTQFNVVTDGGREKAILTIYNAEEPTEKLSFVAPTAEVEIGKKKDGTGGADPIQNLGGKLTYMRRYMFITAFEIAEIDSVESINRELTDEIEEKDLALIKGAKDFESLTKVCGSLKTKYKISLITPVFEEMKQKLSQKEQI